MGYKIFLLTIHQSQCDSEFWNFSKTLTYTRTEFLFLPVYLSLRVILQNHKVKEDFKIFPSSNRTPVFWVSGCLSVSLLCYFQVSRSPRILLVWKLGRIPTFIKVSTLLFFMEWCDSINYDSSLWLLIKLNYIRRKIIDIIPSGF